jgi:hypothetical protein
VVTRLGPPCNFQVSVSQTSHATAHHRPRLILNSPHLLSQPLPIVEFAISLAVGCRNTKIPQSLFTSAAPEHKAARRGSQPCPGTESLTTFVATQAMSGRHYQVCIQQQTLLHTTRAIANLPQSVMYVAIRLPVCLRDRDTNRHASSIALQRSDHTSRRRMAPWLHTTGLQRW